MGERGKLPNTFKTGVNCEVYIRDNNTLKNAFRKMIGTYTNFHKIISNVYYILDSGRRVECIILVLQLCVVFFNVCIHILGFQIQYIYH